MEEFRKEKNPKNTSVAADWLAPLMAKAPRCSPSSWSDIPLELAFQVLDLLPTQVDLVRFAAVCPQWRAAAQQLPPPPPPPPPAVLVLYGGTFYSLPRGERFRFLCCGGRYHSTCGNWLVFSRDDGFFLVDPFSKATMTLPGLSCFQARWEADQTLTWMEKNDPTKLAMHSLIMCSTRHLVAALVSFPDVDENQIVVCRPGASSWSVRAHRWFKRLRSMAFHQGELYVLDSDNSLLAVDISVDHSTGDPWVSRVRLHCLVALSPVPGFTATVRTMLYLVESHGKLLMVRRNIWCGRLTDGARTFVPSIVPRKSTFEAFEANFGRSRWNKVTTVGDDQVLFLSRWSSRAVCVSKHGMPGNRIFFWDDDLYHDGWFYYYDEKSLSSCSAYDMRDGTVSSPLPTISWKRGTVPVTWLFPRD